MRFQVAALREFHRTIVASVRVVVVGQTLNFVNGPLLAVIVLLARRYDEQVLWPW